MKKLERNKREAHRTFAFLDPPYYHKGSELYLNRFDHRQHESLAEFLRARRRFLWVMTYDNAMEVRELYDGFSRIPFDLSYSAFERRAGEELLIHPLNVLVPSEATRSLRQVA